MSTEYIDASAQQQDNYESITAKFNNMIDLANQTLGCGPACQRDKSKNDLYQIYLDSKTNLITAPAQEFIAAKNYYIAAEGESGYNAYLENVLGEKARMLVDNIQTKFQKELTKLMTLIDTYKALNQNHNYTSELYNTHLKENKKLAKELKNNISDIFTNDRKTYYEDQGINNLYFYNKIFIFLYVIVIIVFIIFIIIGLRTRMAIISLIFLLIYPFIIVPILLFFYSLGKRLFDMLPKNIYANL
jgi:hypothetical protein